MTRFAPPTREPALKNFTKYLRHVLIGLLLGLALLYMKMPVGPEQTRDPLAQQMETESAKWFAAEKSLTQFDEDMKAGKVKAIGVGFDYALVNAETRYYVRVGMQRALFQDILKDKSHTPAPTIVSLGDITPPVQGAGKLTRFFEPGYIMIGVVLLLAGMTAKQMGMLKVGPSTFKVEEKPNLRFADVIGVEEAKASMEDLVAFLKNPKRFAALGAEAPRGILMAGPPGTGKTRLARALAGEAGVNVIALTGSDFSDKFMGVGISKVKELFETARKHAPTVVFIDEFDGIGLRGNGAGTPGEAESDRIINALLVELDGFNPSSGIMVIGATNHPEKVDPSIIRPGRFDRTVHLSLPTVHEREALFKMYCAKLVADENLDFAQLARLSTRLSPAAIATVANAAGLLAAGEDAPVVTQAHLLRALDTHRIGSPNSANKAAMTEEERERVAVHEAGHAIIGRLFGTTVDKVTIIPHGPGLGLTLYDAPDRKLYTYEQLRTLVLSLLAGRAAEKLMLGSTSTGASDDLKRATSIVHGMVTQYGFGLAAGLVSFAGLPSAAQRDSVPAEVFSEMRGVLAEFEATCDTTLLQYQLALNTLAERLLAEETVLGAAVDECLALCQESELVA